jgi:hypothetical protein
MGFTSEWYMPRRIIHIRFDRNFNLDDVANRDQTLHDMISQGQRYVYVVADFSQVKSGGMSMQEIVARTTYTARQRFGLTVYVGASSPVKSLFNGVTDLIHDRKTYVATFDDALLFLDSIDSTLGGFWRSNLIS